MRRNALVIALLAAVLTLGGTACSNSLKSRFGQQSEASAEGKKGKKRVVVKMQKEGGVYTIPVKINGVEMRFIFDTGAAVITMSQAEANRLYRMGKLSTSDFQGNTQFLDASGNITESAIFNLKDVTVGNITIHNVQASVSAGLGVPLLLGQTVLSRFGRYTIDTKKMELIIEK